MDVGPGGGTRVLYLALDACDARIVRDLVARGRCPNLAGLLAEGASVETVAPYGLFVSSNWLTIATACRPGQHRYHNWVELDLETYHNRVTSPRESRRTAFWEQLSADGARVAVFDVPHSEAPEQINGAFVKEWGCHDRHHGTVTVPVELRAELEAVSGPHEVGCIPPPFDSGQFAPCDYTLRGDRHRTLDEERRLTALIKAGVEAKATASTALLARGGWDLFMSVLGEGHCAGHQLWHVHDETHPRHDPAARVLLGDPVEDIYDRLDAAVGRHLALVDADTPVYVHLSHGMQAHYDGDHLLDAVLDRLDQPTSAGWRTRAARQLLERLPASARSGATRAAAIAVRRRVASAPPGPPAPPRWRAERRFFQVPNNTVVGGVRINLVDREAEGMVPESERDAVEAEVRAGLLELVNVDTGRPAVVGVSRSDDVVERAHDDTFPDLFVEWDRSAPIERVWSPRTGVIEVPYTHWRTGDHNDRGLLLVRAPGVSPGERAVPLDVVDIAPILSATIGVELRNVDGQPRVDLVPGTATAPAANGAAVAPCSSVASQRRSRSDDARRVADGAVRLAGAAADESDRAHDRVDALEQAMATLAERTAGLEARAERAERIAATTAWLAQQEIPETHLVSVITPTYHRPDRLRRAVDSVLRQRYQRWEMLVVDDGSDTARAVVADVGDERVVLVEADHGGVAAARNLGLDRATGSLVAYLDDDNSLDPGWLAAVVWAFDAHPDDDVLYGARLVDDWRRIHGLEGPGWPWVQLEPFDRSRLEQGNITDMGALAHRVGVQARFDESLSEYADWDLLLALTADRPPLQLPVIAVHYRTDEKDRLSGGNAAEIAAVRAKWGGGSAEPPAS